MNRKGFIAVLLSLFLSPLVKSKEIIFSKDTPEHKTIVYCVPRCDDKSTIIELLEEFNNCRMRTALKLLHEGKIPSDNTFVTTNGDRWVKIPTKAYSMCKVTYAGKEVKGIKSVQFLDLHSLKFEIVED